MSTPQQVSVNFLLMQEKIETQKGENKILRQKLQSKSEALIILSQELDKVRNESEDYRELTRRLQTQWSLLSSDLGGPSNVSIFNNSNQKIAELRDENKRLVTEREHLRKILNDRDEDIKLIRKQWLKEKHLHPTIVPDTEMKNNGIDEGIIKRLESLQIKYDCLKRDLQSLLDEKVDLITERDAYKCKVHRLNHSMAALLKSDGYKSLDVDCLISENRYLRESVEQIKEEKDLANEMGRRYKKALEKTNKTSSTKEVDIEAENAEIRQLITQTSFPCPPDLDLNSHSSLRELAVSLLETLNERMLQLKHQRKANKHLMERVAEVEHKICLEQNDPEAGERLLWPSQYLMKNYSSLNADLDTSEQAKDILRYSVSDIVSPDISDLQKRFDQLQDYAPPDLIDTLVQKPSANNSSTTDDSSEENMNSETDLELPEHLQKLVDKAMAELD